jgi:hypothetical protein
MNKFLVIKGITPVSKRCSVANIAGLTPCKSNFMSHRARFLWDLGFIIALYDDFDLAFGNLDFDFLMDGPSSISL